MTENNNFLNIPAEEINNVPEPQVVRTEDEVQLVVTDIKQAYNKNNEPYIMPRFGFVDYGDAKTFTKYLPVPFEDQPQEDRNQSLRSLKYFYDAFSIDYSNGVDPTDLIGATGWAMVKVNENDGSEYGPQNEIKRFILAG